MVCFMCSLVHCTRAVSINLFLFLIVIIRVSFDGLVSEPLDFGFDLFLWSQLLAGFLNLIDSDLEASERVSFHVYVVEVIEG